MIQFKPSYENSFQTIAFTLNSGTYYNARDYSKTIRYILKFNQNVNSYVNQTVKLSRSNMPATATDTGSHKISIAPNPRRTHHVLLIQQNSIWFDGIRIINSDAPLFSSSINAIEFPHIKNNTEYNHMFDRVHVSAITSSAKQSLVNFCCTFVFFLFLQFACTFLLARVTWNNKNIRLIWLCI